LLFVCLFYSGNSTKLAAIAASAPVSMQNACNASCHVTVFDCSNAIALPNAAVANAMTATVLMMVFLTMPVNRRESP
jgi:hypothetical protein